MFEQAKAFQFIISEQVKFVNIFDNPLSIREGTKPKNKFLRKMQSLDVAGEEQTNLELSQGKKKSSSKAGMPLPPQKLDDIMKPIHPISTLSNGTRSILVSTATPGMSPPDNITVTKFKKQIHFGTKSNKSDGQFVRMSRMKGSMEQVTTPNTNSEQKIRMKIEANHSQQNLASILNGSNQQSSKQFNVKEPKEMQPIKVSPFASPYLSPWAATVLREQFHVDLTIKEQYGTKHWVAKRYKSNESSEEQEQQQIKNNQGKIQSRRDLKRENESSQQKQHYEKLHLQPIILKKPATAAKFISRKKLNCEGSESEINPNFGNSNCMGFR